MTEDAPTGQPPQREPRHSVILSAIVEHFGRGGITRHRVRNLSTGGARIDNASDMQAGVTVLVTVGSLRSVGATVVWVKDGLAGLKFTHSIDIEQARANAVIAPRTADHSGSGGSRGAGWIDNLANPYRK